MFEQCKFLFGMKFRSDSAVRKRKMADPSFSVSLVPKIAGPRFSFLAAPDRTGGSLFHRQKMDFGNVFLPFELVELIAGAMSISALSAFAVTCKTANTACKPFLATVSDPSAFAAEKTDALITNAMCCALTMSVSQQTALRTDVEVAMG
jgi:hypothetical protein